MRRIVALVMCVAVAACSEGGTATTSSPASTVAPPTTTTVVPTTTSTSTVPPSTSPATTLAGNEVPTELLALIGAPMPQVDLTIEGPEDVERWIAEFLRWEAWVSANPEQGLVTLEHFAADQYLEGMDRGLRSVVDAGVLGVGGDLEFRVLSVEDGDFQAGFVAFAVEARRISPRLTVDSVTLEEQNRLEPTGEWVVSDVLIVSSQSGTWKLAEWSSR